MSVKKISEHFRVGVLMGGLSLEREVSFNSARTICDHLDSNLYDIIPIYQTAQGYLYILPWFFLHRGKTSDFESRLDSQAVKIDWDKLRELIDFAYIAQHGRYAEDGTLQGFLEVLGIPYLGAGIFSSALMMDKSFQKTFIKKVGLNIPKGMVISPIEVKNLKEEDLLNRLEGEKVSFPLIVKPSREGSSLGISVVFNKDDLCGAVFNAAYCFDKVVQAVLIEEKIEGMEFVCIALEDIGGGWKALPITEIVPEKGTHFFDYDQKYMPGRASKITPARCSAEHTKLIQEACLKATKAFNGETIVRIDGFLKPDGKVIFIDPQPIPGMGPATFLFHQAAEINMSHTDLINHLIRVEFKKYDLLEKINIPSQKDGVSAMGQTKTRLRVAVLIGGDSNEREISLESGRNICYKLSPSKYEVVPVFVSDKMELYKMSQRFLVQNSTRDISLQLTEDIKIKWSNLSDICDFVFIALHGGKGESGAVQGTLEMLGLPYNGSTVLASSLCIDKYKTNQYLSNQGFDVPKSILVTKQEWEQNNDKVINKIEEVGYPLIIKPHNDGCSFGVIKVDNSENIKASLEKHFKIKSVAMLEECIKATELTCGVIGNDEVQVLSTSQPIINKDILSIEEKFLPGAGENQTPALISKEAQAKVMQIVGDVYKSVGCKGYARIDCFYQDAENSPTGKDKVIILEINTLPGMTPATCIFHQAAEIGLRPMQFLDKIIELGLEHHKQYARESQMPLDKKDKALRIS